MKGTPAEKVDRTMRRLPAWFKVNLTTGQRFIRVWNQVKAGGLNTVCQSAACPNRNECWNRGTATFLLLGNVCTRACQFCNISHGKPGPPDIHEPARIAESIAALGLSYAVVTSVTRDDLPDGGARIFSETIRAIKRQNPICAVEVLIPDFQGKEYALDTVLDAGPDVLNHNIETVPSLKVLEHARQHGLATKSGIMLGLGESWDEVLAVMADLKRIGCECLTIGQYLQPRKDLIPVKRFYAPEEFELLREKGKEMGFSNVVAGPLVRSSYKASNSSENRALINLT
jgi:lipoic acid synthetase